MPFRNEPAYLSDVLAWEEDGRYSRDVVTIANGQGELKIGSVLAKLNANDEYVVAAATGADGSETAIAVLAIDVDATSAAAEAVVIAREATVKRPGLVFGSSIDDQAKRDAAIAQLKAVGILTREGA